MDKLLITLADIQSYRAVADTNQARIDPYINEAQQHDIRPVLGSAFYRDFLAKVDDEAADEYEDYHKLLVGGDYEYSGETIIFPGLKPCLVYYALARYITGNPINMVSYGIVQKVNPQSTPVDTRLLTYNAGALRDIAKSYENQMRQFLDTEISDYPLFDNGRGINTPGGFSMFKG